MGDTASDKLFLSRIDDMIALAEKKGAVYSQFLNDRECAEAEAELHLKGCGNYRFYGVFDNADRKMLCVYREYFEPEDGDFPVKTITFSFRKGEKLSHRDFLGALMALGIKRETVGDIVIDDSLAQIAVCEAVKDVIVTEIKKIGSAGVKYNENFSGLLSRKQQFREIGGTVASLRLDSIAGLAFNLSRSKASELIKSVGAEVNFSAKYDCSFVMKEGDVFSVRGYGKFKLSEVFGTTKKGRIHVKVLKYC